MPSICFYFQVHQPHRLRHYSYFDIGQRHDYFDEDHNRAILEKVAEKCYLPTNALLLNLIKKHDGKFKIAFSISGTAIEQFKQFCPEVLDSFRALVQTQCVELLNETFYHSLSAIFSPSMFVEEVQRHQALIQHEFDYQPTTFRNTELIYSNTIAQMVADLGFQAVLAEGADRILNGRSPNVLYHSTTRQKLPVLLKNYALSDDIAFRFSDRQWEEHPLTADKFSHWLYKTQHHADLINLFMDYETFGEHQWSNTGIFEFMEHLPDHIFSSTSFDYCLPREAIQRYTTRETLDSPGYYSWADSERDLTAWMGNDMQIDALQRIYDLEPAIKQSNDAQLHSIWSSLLTSDHFYYMCTKFNEDGDVHKYFSPYDSPYDAYINYQNVLKDLTLRLTTRA